MKKTLALVLSAILIFSLLSVFTIAGDDDSAPEKINLIPTEDDQFAITDVEGVTINKEFGTDGSLRLWANGATWPVITFTYNEPVEIPVDYCIYYSFSFPSGATNMGFFTEDGQCIYVHLSVNDEGAQYDSGSNDLNGRSDPFTGRYTLKDAWVGDYNNNKGLSYDEELGVVSITQFYCYCVNYADITIDYLYAAPAPQLTNIAPQCTLDHLHGYEASGYNKSLNDGIATQTSDYGSWFGFYFSDDESLMTMYYNPEISDGLNLCADVIVETKELGLGLQKFAVNLWMPNNSGIATPRAVYVYASHDKETWVSIGEMTMPEVDYGFATLETTPFDAEYIKFTLEQGTTGVFLFLNEVEVYGDGVSAGAIDVPEPEESSEVQESSEVPEESKPEESKPEESKPVETSEPASSAESSEPVPSVAAENNDSILGQWWLWVSVGVVVVAAVVIIIVIKKK